jgi:hypothetical protein
VRVTGAVTTASVRFYKGATASGEGGWQALIFAGARALASTHARSRHAPPDVRAVGRAVARAEGGALVAQAAFGSKADEGWHSVALRTALTAGTYTVAVFFPQSVFPIQIPASLPPAGPHVEQIGAALRFAGRPC